MRALTGAALRGANLEDANLRGVTGLSESQIRAVARVESTPGSSCLRIDRFDSDVAAKTGHRRPPPSGGC
ncbi:pentapeptide repeat-containing protein [Actinomadura sp. 3N508]|uniref:pentapeptide repeat-containing protein n=1 Tax=Actinomadura sp. 3N508 TaxID=3375153 RepID=UPI0037A1425A